MESRIADRNHPLQLEDVRTFLTGPRKFEIRDAEYLSLKRDDPGSLPLPDQSLQILEQFRVPQEFADELMAAYVSNFETGYRILHLPTFFRQYSTFWERPQESHTIFKAMLLVVMAIGHGTVVKGQGREISIHEMSEWISVAEHWAFFVPQKDTLRLEYVQLSCLLLLYRRLNTVDLNVPWLCASALVRTAMVMGLHRDPSCFARTTPLHAEIRRRLWYTIVELDLQSAISAGMPPSVTLAHCDCRYPLNLHDEEISEDCGAGEDLPSRDLTTCTRTAFQIVMLRSLETRWRIANIAAMKTRSLSREEFISLDHKLAEWFTAMPPYCTGRTGALTVDIGQSCVLPAAMLKTIHHAAWISLHGASLDQHSIASGHLKQRAMQSALQVLAQLDPPSPAPSVCSLATIGGEMVRDPVLHASFILCLELSAEAEVFAAQSAVPHNNGEPRPLSPATQEMLQSLHSAETYLVYHLRRGLPVSKYYLFLRMAIASVHARLHGKPPLQAVKAAFHAAVGECKSYYASGPKDNMPPDHGVAPLPATFPDWINSSPVAASPADVVAGNETTVNIWSAPSPSLFDILVRIFPSLLLLRTFVHSPAILPVSNSHLIVP